MPDVILVVDKLHRLAYLPHEHQSNEVLLFCFLFFILIASEFVLDFSILRHYGTKVSRLP